MSLIQVVHNLNFFDFLWRGLVLFLEFFQIQKSYQILGINAVVATKSYTIVSVGVFLSLLDFLFPNLL